MLYHPKKTKEYAVNSILINPEKKQLQETTQNSESGWNLFQRNEVDTTLSSKRRSKQKRMKNSLLMIIDRIDTEFLR